MFSSDAMSRRGFVGGIAGSLGYLSVRSPIDFLSRESEPGAPPARGPEDEYDLLAKLHYNENPYGPPESVMKAMTKAYKYANRYGYPDGGIVEGTAQSPDEFDGYDLARPVDPPEVWGAGVTYKRSLDARMEESSMQDLYALVYGAERPELFLKDAACRRTVGPGEPIGVRADSSWDVPEPEIVVVLGRGGELVGLTIGNDVSSRDIEGVNPLYLPQAKIFAGACAVGPAVLVPDDWAAPLGTTTRALASPATAAVGGVLAARTSAAAMVGCTWC